MSIEELPNVLQDIIWEYAGDCFVENGKVTYKAFYKHWYWYKEYSYIITWYLYEGEGVQDWETNGIEYEQYFVNRAHHTAFGNPPIPGSQWWSLRVRNSEYVGEEETEYNYYIEE